MLILVSGLFLLLAVFLLRCLEYGVQLPLEEYNQRMRKSGNRLATAEEYDDIRYNFVPALIRMCVGLAFGFALMHYTIQL